MTRIGIVGLDTSHPEAFAAVLERFRADPAGSPAPSDAAPSITAVWDGGRIRSDDYVEAFCDDVQARRVDDPTTMVDAVDAVFVLTVDWDRHVDLAVPFLEAGIPTLVDKPIAGSRADLDRLETAAANAPLFGGSAVPFHPEFLDLPDAAARRSLTVAGYNDFFYYRAHTVETARRLVGADWTRIAPRPNTEATIVDVQFADGTAGTLRFDGATEPGRFAALDVADRTRTVLVAAGEDTHRRMYEQFLARFLEVCRDADRSATAPVLDGARLLLGVEAALDASVPITPESPQLDEIERPSDQFVAGYEPYY